MPYVHTLRVRFGECDPQGIVFNANYLAYVDVAFTEWWRDACGSYAEMVKHYGLDVVVAEAVQRFRAPARDERWTAVLSRARRPLAQPPAHRLSFVAAMRLSGVLIGHVLLWAAVAWALGEPA